MDEESNELTKLENQNRITCREAERKARYGHRDWVAWHDRGGRLHAARKSPESVKKALLASGTQGKFYIIAASTAVRWLTGWRTGLNMLRQFKYGLHKR